MVKCPNCQAENAESVGSCFLCGQPLKRSWWNRVLDTFEQEEPITDSPSKPEDASPTTNMPVALGTTHPLSHSEGQELHREIDAYDEAIELDPEDADQEQ